MTGLLEFLSFRSRTQKQTPHKSLPSLPEIRLKLGNTAAYEARWEETTTARYTMAKELGTKGGTYLLFTIRLGF